MTLKSAVCYLQFGANQASARRYSPFRSNDQIVLAGFNTDIEFDGKTYHVQTEDKGAPANMIMSLVYEKGTILASKRTTYEDVVGLQREIAERVQRQHKLICAAIRAGRLEDLKRMNSKPSPVRPQPAETVNVGESLPAGKPGESSVVPSQSPPGSSTLGSGPIVNVDLDAVVPLIPLEFIFDEPVIDDVRVIDDPDVITVDAADVITEAVDSIEKQQPCPERLAIELLGESKFRGGERKTITILAFKAAGKKVVSDAQVMVKILGSAFRPVIFHSKTDQNGLAKVHLQLPNFNAGRAAILIRVRAEGEEVELRKLVARG